MRKHMTGIEMLRGNARALGTSACALSGITGSDPQGGNQASGRTFVGDAVA